MQLSRIGVPLHLIGLILAALFELPLPSASAAEPANRRPIDFNRDVRPILSENCFFCHGPDPHERQADLRLDTPEGLFGDRDGVAPVVPGQPDSSELLRRITSEDTSERMPPADSGKELKPEQRETLRRWIAEGAPWSQHWAYQPPERPALPQVHRSDWPRNPIDRFILARLEEEELEPAAEADPVTLVRRLYLDLTGLPPKPEQVDAFLADRREDAYERLVDSLLASPHYGERMAVHWLDLIRYADTVGYHGDQEHHISPYRDYVIKSLNENKPFDEFTIEQLAGDLLPEPTPWQKIATGYNRVLQTTHEGGAQDKEYRAKYAADRVRNASSVWLGSTMGCAECHDHKYDPFTQHDFYSFAAFFADIQERGAYPGPDASPTRREPEMAAWNLSQFAELEQLELQIQTLQQQLESRPEQAEELAKRIEEIEARRAAVQEGFQPTMITVSVEPRIMRVLPRGDWLDESGPVVEPALPHFLDSGSLPDDRRATRLDLARWLVSRENPLTARVFVNRLWKLFFGIGLSRQLDDLGSQGEPPVHPELLEWLAVEFRDSGWNIKHMVRLLVTSRTYRQSSLARPELRTRDPENRLLARQSRWRLEAEFIRDGALAVSGLLVERLGGPSARPYQPAGYYRHLNFPKREYEPDLNSNQYRRGLYMHWQRIFLHPMLKAFDAPSREECTAERPVSNTPAAALVLLNDPTFVEAARVFAARILEHEGDVRDRVAWAWRQVLARPASDSEIAALEQLYHHDRAEYVGDPAAARELLQVGMAPVPDDLAPEDLAAWSSVARALFNLNETITRN